MLLSCMAMLLIVSIDQANWVTEDGNDLAAIAWGLFFGWFLCSPDFAAGCRCLFPGALHSIYPHRYEQPDNTASFSRPFTLLCLGDNLEFTGLDLIYRISGWYQAIIQTKPVEDNGFFIFLLSLMVWLASSWLAWSVVRNRRPLEGLLPYGFLLAVNVHLAHQNSGTFWLFSLLALPLMICTTFIRNQADWDQRGVDYPDSLGLDWSVSTELLTVLIGSVALAVSVFGTPEGLKALNKMVTTTRQKTETTAERLFPDVNPPKYVKALVQARTPDLSDFTRPLPQGKDTILWVKTNDPPPPRLEAHGSIGAAPRHYWRSAVYSTYTAQGWQIGIDYQAPPTPVNSNEPPLGRYELSQEFDIITAHGQQLFAANQPIQTEQPTTLVFNEPVDTALVNGKASVYKVTSWASQATSKELDTASTHYPAEISTAICNFQPAYPGNSGAICSSCWAGHQSPTKSPADSGLPAEELPIQFGWLSHQPLEEILSIPSYSRLKPVFAPISPLPW